MKISCLYFIAISRIKETTHLLMGVGLEMRHLRDEF